MGKTRIIESRETVEKRCTVNFVTSILMTVLSVVLLVMSIGYHKQMRQDLAQSRDEISVIGNLDQSTNTPSTSNGAEVAGGTETKETSGESSVDSSNETSSEQNVGAQENNVQIPKSTLNYLSAYGVSFISAAAGMYYAYKTWKKTERSKLVIGSYCVFAIDVISIFAGTVIRLNLI